MLRKVLGVQRRATKMIPSLKLGIFSLRNRRLKGDRVIVFKLIRDIDKVNLGKLFLYRWGCKNKKT